MVDKNFIVLNNVVIENKMGGIRPTQVHKMVLSKDDIMYTAIIDDRMLPEIENLEMKEFIMKLTDETEIKGKVKDNPDILKLVNAQP